MWGRMKNKSNMFQDINQFPSTETGDAKRTPASRVFRVLTNSTGGNSARVKEALRYFLAHPEPLPVDPGPGPYPVRARLKIADVEKAMALVKEYSQAAVIRRILLWFVLPRKGAAPAQHPAQRPAQFTGLPGRSAQSRPAQPYTPPMRSNPVTPEKFDPAKETIEQFIKRTTR
jgi:hypothetical protein